MNKKITTLIAVLLIVVAGFGTWQWSERRGDDNSSQDTASIDGNEVYNPIGEVTEDEDYEKPLEQTIELTAVNDYEASGKATLSLLENGPDTHTVEATIQQPAEGKFYEGWLVGNGGFISTGKLDGGLNDYWSLEFESVDKDLAGYSQVVITEETEADGLDNKPETHVLEGNF